MKKYLIAFAVALAALAGPALAQTSPTDDPIGWVFDYAYFQATCDSAPPKERAAVMRHLRANKQPPARSDVFESCARAAEMKEYLKSKGYWCVTNAKADLGTPCTPRR
jgi:hypothetical protein